MFLQRNKASQSIKGQESEFTEHTDAEQRVHLLPSKKCLPQIGFKIIRFKYLPQKNYKLLLHIKACWSLSTAASRILNQYVAYIYWRPTDVSTKNTCYSSNVSYSRQFLKGKTEISNRSNVEGDTQLYWLLPKSQSWKLFSTKALGWTSEKQHNMFSKEEKRVYVFITKSSSSNIILFYYF